MTGSAKQSIERQKRKLDCFVANAPRNDSWTQFRDLAACFARALPEIFLAVGRAHEDEINVHEVIANLGAVHEVKLEDGILIALLGAWEEDETRPFFSTTQIAQMINNIFKNTPPKHKDNVSRYFNQDYYAYYEIADSGSSHRRRYRLSNTGYGMAIRALRMLRRLSLPETPNRSQPFDSWLVMPGLVPGIHVFAASKQERRGWPGRSPAMTKSRTLPHELVGCAICENLSMDMPCGSVAASRFFPGNKQTKGSF
jgi:hypothetical protein